MSTPKLRALEEQIASGKITTDNARIIDLLKKNPGTDFRWISRCLRLEQSTTSARLSELEDMGMVLKLDKGSKFSSFYFAHSEETRNMIRRRRANEKLKLWAKRGLKMDISDSLKEELQTLINSEL